MSTVLIVPSLKISGGVREALRLASEAQAASRPVRVICMWRSPHAMASDIPVESLSEWPPRVHRALLELPALMRRFARRFRKDPAATNRTSFIFTHYATLPLAMLVPRAQRLFFVQDLEWRFVRNRLASSLLHRFVRAVYGTGRVVSANAYLSRALAAEGLDVACEMPIWADPGFANPARLERDIDFVMVLRKGAHKRLDLYLRFIELASRAGQVVAVITPEDEIAGSVAGQVRHVALRPDADRMRELYARSKCFVHASEHEGFGLPPLEAMGSGCVPICRDSGGVQAFMHLGSLRELLLPLTLPIEQFHARASALIADERALERHSADAREVFDSGIAICANARRGLADALH